MFKHSFINRLRNLITGKYLKIETYGDDEIVSFQIWENEVYIVADLKNNEVYFDASLSNHHMDAEMLSEISSVCREIELNLNDIKEWVKEDDGE